MNAVNHLPSLAPPPHIHCLLRERGEDAQVRKHHINQNNPLAEHGRLERRQESRNEKNNRQNRNDQVENSVCATTVLAVHEVGVETHGDDGTDPLHGSGGQEDGPGESWL